ncbi:hypothetical protein GOV11_04500 [Candidatus Woesearchaeota archaeon]|nr:hypothetical protein [Candidatus Woesearchaeota archaeon]
MKSNKTSNFKRLTVFIGALLIALFVASSVSAYGPYDGVNRIGTYWGQSQAQWGQTYFSQGGTASYTYKPTTYSYSGTHLGSMDFYSNRAYRTHQYQYPWAPRTGGWFGSGMEYMTGLRPGIYNPIPPVSYSVRSYSTCTWPNCYLGGNGYSMGSTGGYTYRSRIGGAYV